MKVNRISANATISKVKELLAANESLSSEFRDSVENLLLLATLLLNKLGLDSRNSSIPPSADPNREKKPKEPTGRKPGGQPGHAGKALLPIPDPDEVVPILVDRTTIPEEEYSDVGYEARQVFDLVVKRVVTEWRAQILIDSKGKRYVAPFPDGVTRPAQYGIEVKVNAVYMSQYQLIPYNRVEDHFQEQLHIPVSNGSLGNFNREAYNGLELFEQWLKGKLIHSPLLHGDETGINIGGKRHWLHNISTGKYTYLFPHNKRGGEAMDAMGILPEFQGILCHDHWKAYYRFAALHALCNGHHLRELERAWEEDNQKWAKGMSALLKEINQATEAAGGCLEFMASEHYRKRYRDLLQEAEKECPPPTIQDRKGRRGKIPRTKSRNLLERLRDFEGDVLRFMDNEIVPFTNNQAERDLRMTKVHQKISGYFRSMEGAKVFCRIRSYLSTCRKHGVTASTALRLLFEGKQPAFMSEN